MWRQNGFPENPDSDLSISDEEDFNCSWPNDCVSLGEQAENKRKLGIQSQFATLRGTDKLLRGRIISSLSQKKQAGVSSEDVKIPDFQHESDLSCSPEKAYASDSDVEKISDDEENNVLLEASFMADAQKSQKVTCHSFGNKKKDESETWSAVNKEAESLVRLNENASSSSSYAIYSRPIKSSEGFKVKARPKFSFCFQSPKEGVSWPPISMIKVHESENSGVMEHKSEGNSISEHLDEFHGEEVKQLEVLPAEVEGLGNGCIQHSMAELLGCLQDKNSVLQENTQMHSRTGGRKTHHVTKRSISSLGDRIIDNEDPPEPMGSGSSSDDEHLKLIIPEKKRQTMVDRFQEVIGATSSNEGGLFAIPRLQGVGLFGKLQQVMQAEKERDTAFLKRSQAGASSSDEPGCVNVKILSRYLDAKLTVCHCSLADNDENNLHWTGGNETAIEDEGSKQTIIFSPRVCSDVELEVGNMIRIHPPWKEVQIMNTDERLILSTYFSQI